MSIGLTFSRDLCYNTNMITIVGIGTEKGELTERGAAAIQNGKHVFLRTAKTNAGKAVWRAYPHVTPLDDVYESASSFDDWAEKVCARLCKAQDDFGEAVYLTDGEGTDGVTERLAENGIACTHIFGVCPHRTRTGAQSVLRLTATDAVRQRPYLDTALPLHITEIDDRNLAGELKLWLMAYYADEHPVTLHAGGKTQIMPLCDIDRQQKYDCACELYIESAAGFYKQKFCFGDLLRIMDRLVAPDGCPWDKAQTHESIRTNLIEEAYEATDAIDANDLSAMQEEFGDVLLQAVFHCNMSERTGEFSLADVLTTLCEKLVGRHTHIFGKNKAADADEALLYWEAAKSKEKSYTSVADKINRLPEGFPALLAAQKAYKKLHKAGVLPPDIPSVQDANCEDAFGKLLFALCARASENDIDAEVALNRVVKACKRDFSQAEQSGNVADFLQKLCK